MRIYRTSDLTGKTTMREIDVTDQQLLDWEGGTRIQDAMPHLSTDDREFIMTGITPEEWDNMLGDAEYDDFYDEEIARECQFDDDIGEEESE